MGAQTRMQAKGNPYRSSMDVVRHIVREQGVRGLWVGSTPSMVCLSQGALPGLPCSHIVCSGTLPRTSVRTVASNKPDGLPAPAEALYVNAPVFLVPRPSTAAAHARGNP